MKYSIKTDDITLNYKGMKAKKYYILSSKKIRKPNCFSFQQLSRNEIQISKKSKKGA